MTRIKRRPRSRRRRMAQVDDRLIFKLAERAAAEGRWHAELSLAVDRAVIERERSRGARHE
jgi:hypothetical protein